MKLVNNPFTTTVGVLLALTMIALIIRGYATFSEASGFIIIALALIVSKDASFFENFFPKNKNSNHE